MDEPLTADALMKHNMLVRARVAEHVEAAFVQQATGMALIRWPGSSEYTAVPVTGRADGTTNEAEIRGLAAAAGYEVAQVAHLLCMNDFVLAFTEFAKKREAAPVPEARPAR